VVVVVVGARLRLDSGRRLPWDPGEGVAQRLSGSDVTLSIVYCWLGVCTCKYNE
jgi:hypothetical protein